MMLYLDGNNICFWRDAGRFSLVTLLNVCRTVQNQGHDFTCFFDANAQHLITDNNEASTFKELLKDRQKFKMSPGGMRADDFILLSADQSKASIISNDRFKNFVGQYPWIESKSGDTRLIKGMINIQADGDYLMIPALKINCLLETNIPKLISPVNSSSNQKNQNKMATEFKPTGVKVPKVFHQLGILVLDGSGSMTEKGPSNTTKANHVSSAVIELFNRMNVSRVKQNFSFACIKFDTGATMTMGPTAFDHSVFMNQSFDPTDGKGGGTHIYEALSEAQRVADNFLNSAQGDGLPHKVLILLMTDGMCFDGNKTKSVASAIKSNPKIQIASAYFAEVGKVDVDAQNLLKEISSDLGTGPAFSTVYDGETLRAFFERSISQSSGTKIE